MLHKYWPYILIIICVLFFILTWPISKNRNIVLPSKMKEKITYPTPTVNSNKNDQLLDKNEL